MVQNTKAKIATYSLRTLCEFKGKVLEDGFEGMLMDINNREVNVQFIGRFNASNYMHPEARKTPMATKMATR